MPIPIIAGLLAGAAQTIIPAAATAFAGRLLGAGAPVQRPTFTPAQLAPILPSPIVPRTRTELERQQALRALTTRRRVTSPFPDGAAGGLPRGALPLDGPTPRGYHVSEFVTQKIFMPHYARNRRMKPTNVRALRRAVRRARSFKRITRKVNALLPSRTARFSFAPRRRRRFRGDILPFEHDGTINPYAAEDFADYLDEAEDLGLPFPGDDEEATE